MSLLFDHVIDRFDRENATLYSVTEGDLDASGPSVPIEPVAAFASHHDALADPEEDWTCIPLHGVEGAAPTGEFVAYTDHPLHGEVVVFERDGERDAVDIETFGETTLADRCRFWHSDFVPDQYPPGYDSPIDDSEPARNPRDRETLFEDLLAYVEREREAAREENRARARRHSAATIYRQGGDAVPQIEAVGEDDGAYRFRVDLPPDLADARDGDWAFFVESEFGIHEGNEVLLTDQAGEGGGGGEAFPLGATVERIRGLNVWLAVDWTGVEGASAAGNALRNGTGSYGLVALLNPVPFDRERAAVESLRDHRLGDVLAGERPITFAHGGAADSERRDADLNQEQGMAVEHALLADDVFPVHGPPGTGKTRTLVEIVRRAAAAGESVLVCADSNQAVDNLLVGGSTPDDADDRSLHAYGQHGAGEFRLDRVKADHSASTVVRRAYGDVPGRADVMAATNNSAATLAREFDLLVLDEATQATCTASCIPLALADRVVLAGDHRQLPPYSATEDPPESSYGDSLFEHCYADGGVYERVGLQLQTQYRMHRDVAYFPNRRFYDRTLRNGRSIEPLEDFPALEGYNVGGAVETVDHSKANPTEARLVVHLLEDLLATLPAAEVGVITPYAAQVDCIEAHLEARCEGNAGGVVVDTIDAFQGSERTAIVLSLVRSNADGDLGFLGRPADGPRRLNVALTRAKRYCAVVADWHTLRYETDGKATDLYREFYRFFETTDRLRHVDPDFLPVAPLDE